MVCPPKVDSQKLVAKVNASQVVCVRTYNLELVCVRTYISKTRNRFRVAHVSSTWVFRNIRESVPPSLKGSGNRLYVFARITLVLYVFARTTLFWTSDLME